jgi:glycerophosphoryl diester phosphodiesterase
MQILAHRGWWTDPSEKNSESALHRALAAGFGIETDIRDCAGALVISHDMPPARTDGMLTVERLLALHAAAPGSPTLALNIKADGLAASLHRLLARHGTTAYFVFDMSVPDTLGYLQMGMTVHTRRSEFETGSALDTRARGLWLDSFESPHAPLSTILEVLESGRHAAVVSPELHRKPYIAFWQALRRLLDAGPSDWSDRLMLCTDYPDDARKLFG